MATILQELYSISSRFDMRLLHTMNKCGTMPFLLPVLVDLQLGGIIQRQKVPQFFVVQLNERAFDRSFSLISLELAKERV